MYKAILKPVSIICFWNLDSWLKPMKIGLSGGVWRFDEESMEEIKLMELWLIEMRVLCQISGKKMLIPFSEYLRVG